MLLQKLKEDKLEAVRAEDVDRKNAINMILGELPRLNKTKDEDINDGEIIAIINKLIKSEVTTLEYSNNDPNTSTYIQHLKSYLPKMMTEEEIFVWILDNLNMDDYDIPMKAMRVIMRDLKGKADGNLVKKVLTRIHRS